ncbi:MAG: uncharacterized protein A8A55_1440 [Amphiamblys sp. WSBS2006]|nr:MAG: uncharacterized protein A8A55_1440 [Amphiamblys sp. WSBS2006]
MEKYLGFLKGFREVHGLLTMSQTRGNETKHDKKRTLKKKDAVLISVDGMISGRPENRDIETSMIEMAEKITLGDVFGDVLREGWPRRPRGRVLNRSRNTPPGDGRC